jgi:hypothetical protein
VSKKISEESKNAVFEPRTESNQNNKTVDMAEVSVPNEAPLSPTAAYLLSLPPLPESRSETPELEKE